MMKCPACAHENVDGTTFCEMCSEELQAAATSTAPVAATETAGDIACPACENLNPRDNVACEVCGAELRAATDDAAGPVADDAPVPLAAEGTTTVEADEMDTVVADDTSTPVVVAAALLPGQIKLVVEQGMNVGKQFVLGDAEIQVGREDEDEEIYPDIDLSDQDEGFVHRKHATLTFENDQLYVKHLGGANKTRLNNKPIPDDVPQAVKLGDKIAFGKVVLRVLPHA